MSPEQSQTLEKTSQPQKRRHGAQAAKAGQAAEAAQAAETAQADTNPSQTESLENQKILFSKQSQSRFFHLSIWNNYEFRGHTKSTNTQL